MIKPIVIIPTYNHHKQLSSIIEKIQFYKLDIVIVDDCSNVETKAALVKIRENTDVHLMTLKSNGGKGAAVKAGIRYAHSKGYSHCIQIDADGQHNPQDLPKILDLVNQYPQRLILGKPVFNLNSAPKARIWGRKVTNFWIAVETMSLDIKDGLCGYRCYPVSATMRIIDKVKTGNRMDFDPEILVRLRWQGIKVKSFDTCVTYDNHEPSHFNIFFDNVRISFLFMKLFWIGLAGFIWKKAGKKKRAHTWSEKKERGNSFFINLTFLIYRLFKKRLTQLVLQPVLLYFFITDKNGRNGSINYLNRVYKKSSSKLSFRPGLLESFIHYKSFASSVLDKIGIRIPEKNNEFKIEYYGYELVNSLIENKRGALFIGAHFGNFDVIRLLAKEASMQLKVLMYRKHAQMINDLFSSINNEKNDEILEIESINAATAGMLVDYIDNGGSLGILGDRVSPGSENKVIRFPFLGKEAKFPQGPWIIAGILKCPVIFFYAVSTGLQKYEIHFEKLFESVQISSRDRDADIKKYMEEYVKRLEKACCFFSI